ncbi:MAG: hypothetical protein M9962_15050 [Oligoflexia bacterium]|nr:hypothetical protein [Oligoflexia bacterium]
MKNTFLYFSILCFALPAWAKTDLTKRLEKAGQLQVPYKECEESATKLGQLLYINVDDNGNSPGTIDPGYIRLVEEIQPGGMIVHTTDLIKARDSIEKIHKVSKLPPITGVDFVRASTEKTSVDAGQGYQEGMLGKVGNSIPLSCLGKLAYLDAFLHKALGINQALGPTVEFRENNPVLSKTSKERALLAKHLIHNFAKIGVGVVAKHFPHIPETGDNHKNLKDETLSLDEEMQRIEVFNDLRYEANFFMTTHYWNTNIDSEIVTLSKVWIDKLRSIVGDKSIIMTDGMYMMGTWGANVSAAKAQNNQYQLKDPPPLSDITLFSARAILAGHDMVMLESTSVKTRKVFRELHRLSCQDSDLGKALSKRIRESYSRISSYKALNKANLILATKVPEELISQVTKAYGNHSYGGFMDSNWKVYSANSPLCTNEIIFEELKYKIQQIYGDTNTNNPSTELDTSIDAR